MVALSTSRLVWAAIVSISPTTSPMLRADPDKARTVLSVAMTASLASRATWAARVACNATSPIDAGSFSATPATETTFSDASSDAPLTAHCGDPGAGRLDGAGDRPSADLDLGRARAHRL